MHWLLLFERPGRRSVFAAGAAGSIPRGVTAGSRCDTCDGWLCKLSFTSCDTLFLAKKSGHLTVSRTITVLGGKEEALELKLIPLADASRTVRRWDVWKPWAVAGGGVLVAALGFAFGRASVSARDDYEQGFATACPEGCREADIPAPVVFDKDRAYTFHGLEVASYSVGGAAVVTSAVLLFMNREQKVLLDESGAAISAPTTPGAMSFDF